MKALSLTQPWATLVAIGAKNIETRSWRTDYRGWLAIHAAKTMPRWAKEICFDEPILLALKTAAGWDPDTDQPGSTGLWTVPFDLEARIREQVKL